ncbi:MAG: hypothetical protein ACRDNK_22100, partial [Solirubrobacteraceae bacterium]
LDLAHTLREEAYELSARASTATVRTNAIGSCLLLRSEDDPCDALASVPGTGALLQPGNKRGEALLEPFDLLLPLRPHFDLATNGRQLVDGLAAAGVYGVLIEAMPRRFQVFADTSKQMALVPQGFVELVDLASGGRPRDGQLTVLVPVSSGSATSKAVRASGGHEADEVLLGCTWQRWSYRPDLQQLPLVEDQPKHTLSAPLTTGAGGAEPTGGPTYYIAGDAHFSTVVMPDLDVLAGELSDLKRTLRGSGLTDELALVEEAQLAAGRNDKAALRRWVAGARPYLAQAATDLGLSALQRLLGV